MFFAVGDIDSSQDKWTPVFQTIENQKNFCCSHYCQINVNSAHMHAIVIIVSTDNKDPYLFIKTSLSHTLSISVPISSMTISVKIKFLTCNNLYKYLSEKRKASRCGQTCVWLSWPPSWSRCVAWGLLSR